MGNSDKEMILWREGGQRLGLELAGLPGQVVQSFLLGQGPEQPIGSELLCAGGRVDDLRGLLQPKLFRNSVKQPSEAL